MHLHYLCNILSVRTHTLGIHVLFKYNIMISWRKFGFSLNRWHDCVYIIFDRTCSHTGDRMLSSGGGGSLLRCKTAAVRVGKNTTGITNAIKAGAGRGCKEDGPRHRRRWGARWYGQVNQVFRCVCARMLRCVCVWAVRVCMCVCYVYYGCGGVTPHQRNRLSPYPRNHYRVFPTTVVPPRRRRRRESGSSSPPHRHRRRCRRVVGTESGDLQERIIIMMFYNKIRYNI